jgi:hypothetical protein
MSTYASLLLHTARPNTSMCDGVAKQDAGVRYTYRDRGTRQIAPLHEAT